MTAEKINELIEKYGDDEKALLRDNASLDILLEFSNQRAGIIDWLDIKKDDRILFAGNHVTAIKRALAGNASEVYESGNEIKNIYDYIISIGTIQCFNKDDIEKLYASLKTGGKMIVACDNKYGVKFLNGAERSESAFTKNALKELLGDNLSWYYPMPDYKLPVSIYSDDYLPQPGELLKTISAYDDAEYALRNLGTLYDEVVRDGEFGNMANSFLVIKTKS